MIYVIIGFVVKSFIKDVIDSGKLFSTQIISSGDILYNIVFILLNELSPVWEPWEWGINFDSSYSIFPR